MVAGRQRGIVYDQLLRTFPHAEPRWLWKLWPPSHRDQPGLGAGWKQDRLQRRRLRPAGDRLEVINWDRTGHQSLDGDDGSCSYGIDGASWSPDAQRIAYRQVHTAVARPTRETGFFTIKPDGTDRQKLPAGRLRPGLVARRHARSRSANGQIWTMNSDGTGVLGPDYDRLLARLAAPAARRPLRRRPGRPHRHPRPRARRRRAPLHSPGQEPGRPKRSHRRDADPQPAQPQCSTSPPLRPRARAPRPPASSPATSATWRSAQSAERRRADRGKEHQRLAEGDLRHRLRRRHRGRSRPGQQLRHCLDQRDLRRLRPPQERHPDVPAARPRLQVLHRRRGNAPARAAAFESPRATTPSRARAT